jgi:PAS domain S-box-containing protein
MVAAHGLSTALGRDMTTKEDVPLEQGFGSLDARHARRLLEHIRDGVQIRDAVVVMDDEGKVAYWNRAAKDMFGYTTDEVIGKDLHALIAPERFHARYHAAFPHFLKTGDGDAIGKVIEVVAKTHDGGEFPIELSLSGFETDGRWWSVGFVRDITERKRLEEKLIAARDAAERATRAKGEFLANMSHEIRTPMNAIIGMAQLTLETQLTAEQRENLGIVVKAADGLLDLIDNILDVSKLDAGRLRIEIIPYAPTQVIKEVIDTVAAKAHEKGLTLRPEIDPSAKGWRWGDPTRVRQVLMNLLGNAIKFTSVGEIVVRLRVDDETLRLEVQDTGIGIPRDRQGRVFIAFEQVDGSTSRRFGGTGLGLSITKQLVERMEGQLGLESQEGAGSLFWVELNELK